MMTNLGVKCNVCECMHNSEGSDCALPCIEVTHEKKTSEGVAIPHFCKSYDLR